VEEVLYRHPKVEAAVIGIPDDVTGEAIKALLVAREGESTIVEEIRDCDNGKVVSGCWV